MPHVRDVRGKTIHRCMKIDRIKDAEGRGRREWVRENEMQWDCWDALASKKWVRMESTGRVNDEGRAVSERVDLMDEFFGNVHRRCLCLFSFFGTSLRRGSASPNSSPTGG